MMRVCVRPRARPELRWGFAEVGIGLGINVLLLVLVALGGLVLVMLGLRGRRLGSEPRCRVCEYNLTGLTSDRCPECGATLSPTSVAYGVRCRNRIAIVAGVVVLAFTLGVLVLAGSGSFSQVNKYRYYPFWWVMVDAEAGTKPAADELMQRLRAGKVSAAQRRKLVRAALKQQAVLAVNAATQTWVDMLEVMAQRGTLPEAQEQKFLEQMCVYSLRLRPRIRQGERLVVGIVNAARAPSSVACFRYKEIAELRIGGRAVPIRPGGYSGGSSSGVGNVGHLTSCLTIPDLGPGTYKVVCVVADKLFRKRPQDPSEERPDWSGEVILDGEVEIVPAGAPDTVTVVDDPSKQKEFEQLISVSRITVFPGRKGMCYVDIYVDVGGPGFLPVSAAFDVFIKTSQGTHRVGELSCVEGKMTKYSMGGLVPAFDADEVMVLLRASREVARRTVDLSEIWGGELTLGPIQVVREGR